MISEYECKCEDCLSYYRRPKAVTVRNSRIKKQSKMIEFDGWREEIKDFYNMQCAKCTNIDNLQIDHIIPLSLGGDHAMYNMQILCKRCNFEKSNKNSIDYRSYPKLIAITVKI